MLQSNELWPNTGSCYISKPAKKTACVKGERSEGVESDIEATKELTPKGKTIIYYKRQ